MKLNLLIVTLFALTTTTAYSQEKKIVEGYELEYEVSWDSNRRMKADLPFSPEQIEAINRMSNSIRSYYTLYSNTEVSVYEIKKKTYSEEHIKNNKTGIPKLQPLDYPLIYKQLGTKDIYITNGKVPHNKSVKTTFDEVNQWTLVSEDTLVQGYQCFKAIHKLEEGVEAWYTTDIPLSDGPYYYAGLPGLIVVIQNKKRQLYVQLTSLKLTSIEKEVFSPKIPTKYISFEQYNKSSNVNAILRQ